MAVYLDDQSFQFPSRNVDIYVVDMNRVEVLEGPQGTLFGGGAEAGAVRYITNKPNPTKYEANAEGSYGSTSGGAENSSVNATLNVPLIHDKLALRAVVYDERRGGYIDNVPSTFTRSNSDIGNFYFGLAPTNGIRPNKLPAAGSNGCTLASSPQSQINNAAIAQKDRNPTTYQGARISALYDINEDWNVLIQQSFQDLDAEGLSAEYPTGSDFQPLKALQVTSFTPSYDKDRFENTSWTLNGKIGPLRAIYTGGYLDRHISQQMEYTKYSRTGGGIYYQCAGGGAGSSLLGAGNGQPLTCYSPQGYWQDSVKNTHLTQEARIGTPDDWRLRAIAGVYYEDFKIYNVQNFNYKTVPACNAANLALAPGMTCLADVRRYIIPRLTHGFGIRCLRFTSDVAAAHARLASGWRATPLPGGGRTLWTASKGLRLHTHSPFQDFSCRKGRLRQAGAGHLVARGAESHTETAKEGPSLVQRRLVRTPARELAQSRLVLC